MDPGEIVKKKYREKNYPYYLYSERGLGHEVSSSAHV